ncbi:hypothetical protein V494_02970 [Pseudogymnoascus sp. VKM F-4513 (FW-928)]|nr:hypothetical protein V494_02970 [Pseudogymnoascus sp. VKM F-4513 (FW-928)]
MAHQAHAIPWGVLSSNFKFTSKSQRHGGKTNLYPRRNAAQGKELMYFARGFAQAVEAMSRTEREKYPQSYDEVGPSDFLIDDVTEAKIRNTVRRARMANTRDYGHRGPCPVTYIHGCTCPISPEDRTILPWKVVDNMNQYPTYPSPHEDSPDLLNALLLHGQIDALLRIAAQPSANLKALWDPISYRGSTGFGELMRATLMSYICLNVSYLKPETYNATARAAYLAKEHRDPPTELEDMDYRKTRGYVKMLRRCTDRSSYDVHLYPHREFYGIIPDKPPVSWGGWRDVVDLATQGAKITQEYMPLKSDIPVVTRYLQQKGLPLELALDILDRAEYIPRRRLLIPGDPLHHENAEELRKYLKFCWKLLVSCNVLAEATGKKIHWVYEITRSIVELWSADGLKTKRENYDQIGNEYLTICGRNGFSFV